MGKNKKKGVKNSLSAPLSCSKETIGFVLKDGSNPIVTAEASKLHAHHVFDDMSESKSKAESSLKASYTLGQDDTDSISVEEYESSVGNEEETPKLNEELPTLVATKENSTKPSWSSLFKDNGKAIEGIELSVHNPIVLSISSSILKRMLALYRKLVVLALLGMWQESFQGKKHCLMNVTNGESRSITRSIPVDGLYSNSMTR